MKVLLFVLLHGILAYAGTKIGSGKARWSVSQANEWYSNQSEWIVGCNFLPSNAANQFEMWQKDTFDLVLIKKEIQLASSLGFNTLRVYLHDLIWSHDGENFLQRIDQFLDIAIAERMLTILVLFDDCHRPDPKYGKQPKPVKGVHNSIWKQSPGAAVVKSFHDGTVSAIEVNRLQAYVTTLLKRFATDTRVLMWDLYNEPGRSGQGNKSYQLLLLTWNWAQAVRPSQPLTSCVSGSIGKMNKALNIARSDVLTFHEYDGDLLPSTMSRTQREASGRPVICTEFMSREFGTTFQRSLPLFYEKNVGCISWGLVAGRSQTHFNWATISAIDDLGLGSPGKRQHNLAYLEDTDPLPEPKLWFHDIFRGNGSAYDELEVQYIRNMTAKRFRKSIVESISNPRRRLLAVDDETDSVYGSDGDYDADDGGDESNTNIGDDSATCQEDKEHGNDDDEEEIVSESREIAADKLKNRMEFLISLYGRRMELYLDKFEDDVYLQRFDESFVRNAAAAFCTMHAKEFKVSELALERGCVLPVFNQLFMQINIRKDELAAKSQQENEEKMMREREEEIANSREFIITANNGVKYKTFFNHATRKPRSIASMFCQRMLSSTSESRRPTTADILSCVEPIQASLEKQVREYLNS